MLIGHNPGVGDLTELLIGHGDPIARQQATGKFPTAAVAVLSVTGEWRELQPANATIDSYWQPRPLLEQVSPAYSTACFQRLRNVTSRAGRRGAAVNVSPV